METSDVRAADDETLLARLLTPSLGQARAGAAAADLLARFGGLAATLAAPLAETRRVLGADASPCAEQLASMHELMLAALREEVVHRPLLGAMPAVRAYLKARLAHESREQFRVLHLDARHHLIVDDLMGAGTIDHAPVYPREVVRRALELGAKSLILVHNHPAGDPKPSGPDVRMTELLFSACAALELVMIDHLVIGRHGVCSFREAELGPWRPAASIRQSRAPLRRVASS